MGAAVADGPLPFGDIVAGGILSIAATVDIYHSLVNPQLRGTHTTYQPVSQNPLNSIPGGFNNKNYSPGNGGNPLEWLIWGTGVGALGKKVYDTIYPDGLPSIRDNTNVKMPIVKPLYPVK